MTYYDALNDFFKSLGSARLASSAQLVYLHLLQLNNRSGNCGVVHISDRELNELTQLSRPTVTKAKQILKNRGLIDFKSGNRDPRTGTCYILHKFSQPVSQSVSQSLSQSVSQSAGVSNIRVREKDVKTEDNQSISQSRGRACAFNWDVETEERLTALWLENCGAGVTFELLSYLRFIVEKHGLTFAEDLIREMAGSLKGDRMTLNYLRGAYNFKLKGGDRNVRVAQRPVNNRPNVLAFTAQRTAGDFGDIESGKGRFDDEEPDYSWIQESDSGNHDADD